MQLSGSVFDVQEKRKEWKGFAEKTDSKKLVFLDESGVNVNMTRPYGCSKGKSRVVDSVPLNKPTITTIISSIRLDGKIVHTAFQGAITGDLLKNCLLYTSPSPRDSNKSRMPSSA